MYKLGPANDSEAGKVIAGVAKSNDSLLLDIWLASAVGSLLLKPKISTGP